MLNVLYVYNVYKKREIFAHINKYFYIYEKVDKDGHIAIFGDPYSDCFIIS